MTQKILEKKKQVREVMCSQIVLTGSVIGLSFNILWISCLYILYIESQYNTTAL
jgi:multisubunit Na+/H+ antiporter MnhC subunit